MKKAIWTCGKLFQMFLLSASIQVHSTLICWVQSVQWCDNSSQRWVVQFISAFGRQCRKSCFIQRTLASVAATEYGFFTPSFLIVRKTDRCCCGTSTGLLRFPMPPGIEQKEWNTCPGQTLKTWDLAFIKFICTKYQGC